MDAPFRRDRRRALRRMAALAGAAALLELPLLSGCAPGSGDAPGTVRLPLASLIPGKKTVVYVGGFAVELTRRDDGVVGRSLLCTHQGCTVRWDEAANRYKCPCHHGEYDAEGKVLIGPPPRPLAAYPVEIAGDTVVLRPRVATTRQIR
jgi:cytochrome b6-f complex iron-sulfur subunit